jgi:hypothetical protein
MKKIRPKKRFELLREFQGMGLRTYEEIAEATGLARSTVASVCAGWKFPGPEAQARIIITLGISSNRLEGLL